MVVVAIIVGGSGSGVKIKNSGNNGYSGFISDR
jgi:hypothetical protein